VYGKLLEILKGRIGDALFIALAFVGTFAAVLWLISTFVLGQGASNRNLYYQRTVGYCEEASRVAAQVALKIDLKESKARFNVLYYGELVLYEDSALSQAMVAFHTAINSQAPPANPEVPAGGSGSLMAKALRISDACYALIQPTFFDQVRSWFGRHRPVGY
jgi:hypothetical protein